MYPFVAILWNSDFVCVCVDELVGCSGTTHFALHPLAVCRSIHLSIRDSSTS